MGLAPSTADTLFRVSKPSPDINFSLDGLKKNEKWLFWCVIYKEDMKLFCAGKGEGFESE